MEPKKILVVEDWEQFCHDLRQKLSDLGHRVDILFDGQELLDTYAPGRYDVILMDTEMKHSVGYEVCAKLRERDKYITIIGMSTDNNFGPLWMEAGADSFLQKLDLYRELEEKHSATFLDPKDKQLDKQ